MSNENEADNEQHDDDADDDNDDNVALMLEEEMLFLWDAKWQVERHSEILVPECREDRRTNPLNEQRVIVQKFGRTFAKERGNTTMKLVAKNLADRLTDATTTILQNNRWNCCPGDFAFSILILFLSSFILEDNESKK